MTKQIDHEKQNRNDAADYARRQYGKEMREADKIAGDYRKHRHYETLKRKLLFQKYRNTPRVAKINWVKDTPLSLALAFIRWRDAQDT